MASLIHKSIISFSAYNPVLKLNLLNRIGHPIITGEEPGIAGNDRLQDNCSENQGYQRLLWFAGLLLIISPLVGGAVRIEHLTDHACALFIEGLGFILDFWQGKGKWLVFIVPGVIVLLSWIFSGELFAGISPRWNMLVLNLIIPILALLIIY